jgi:hypothetical protein
MARQATACWRSRSRASDTLPPAARWQHDRPVRILVRLPAILVGVLLFVFPTTAPATFGTTVTVFHAKGVAAHLVSIGRYHDQHARQTQATMLAYAPAAPSFTRGVAGGSSGFSGRISRGAGWLAQ